MEIEDVVPPGEHRHDPYVKELDPVTWALARALVHIDWIGEHWYTYQHVRDSDPARAEEELRDLLDSQRQAKKHLSRLAGLVMAGYARDPSKTVDKNLLRRFDKLDAADRRPCPKDGKTSAD